MSSSRTKDEQSQPPEFNPFLETPRPWAELSPPDWLVAFFAEAVIGDLPSDWLRRLALKQSSLQKCICEAPDRTTNGACSRASTRVAEDRTTRTPCSRAHNRSRCRTRDWIFFRIFFVGLSSLGSRLSVSDTFVDILLGYSRSNTQEMGVGREHGLLRCTGGDHEQSETKCRHLPNGVHNYTMSPSLYGSRPSQALQTAQAKRTNRHLDCKRIFPVSDYE